MTPSRNNPRYRLTDVPQFQLCISTNRGTQKQSLKHAPQLSRPGRRRCSTGPTVGSWKRSARKAKCPMQRTASPSAGLVGASLQAAAAGAETAHMALRADATTRRARRQCDLSSSFQLQRLKVRLNGTSKIQQVCKRLCGSRAPKPPRRFGGSERRT